MKKNLNTNIDFEFYDGTTVKMTLFFYALYQLKNKNKTLYDRYNKIVAKKESEEIEMITVLYTAYVCANLNEDDLLSEEEFMMKCGGDRQAVNDAIEKLLTPKKR